MIDLRLDLSQFEKAARDIEASVDQVPFALSRAMNEAARVVRLELIETWNRSLAVRNRSFIRAALLTRFSDKNNLRVSIYDALGRAHLAEHASGGMKQARGRLAIPGTVVKRSRGARGVPPGFRPMTMPNAFRKGEAIYQRQKNGRLTLMYVLKQTAQIRKDVPFREVFRARMQAEIDRTFPAALQRAMRTRRT